MTSDDVKLLLIRGLPGSGKTTLAEVMAKAGYEHYETDQYFYREGVYRREASELSKAHAWCLESVRESLSRGARCVVSNTFTKIWEMKPYLELVKTVGDTVLVLEAQGTWVNVHGVPGWKIDQMRERWQSIEANSLPGWTVNSHRVTTVLNKI